MLLLQLHRCHHRWLCCSVSTYSMYPCVPTHFNSIVHAMPEKISSGKCTPFQLFHSHACNYQYPLINSWIDHFGHFNGCWWENLWNSCHSNMSNAHIHIKWNVTNGKRYGDTVHRQSHLSMMINKIIITHFRAVKFFRAFEPCISMHSKPSSNGTCLHLIVCDRSRLSRPDFHTSTSRMMFVHIINFNRNFRTATNDSSKCISYASVEMQASKH